MKAACNSHICRQAWRLRESVADAVPIALDHQHTSLRDGRNGAPWSYRESVTVQPYIRDLELLGISSLNILEIVVGAYKDLAPQDRYAEGPRDVPILTWPRWIPAHAFEGCSESRSAKFAIANCE